jgi:hypothetical protein
MWLLFKEEFEDTKRVINLARCAMGFGVSNGLKLALLGIVRFGV